jgi:uncharacterized glyoxalase superfamily protein PhnB
VTFYQRLGFDTQAWRDSDEYGFLQRDGQRLHLSRSEQLTSNQVQRPSTYISLKGTAESLQAKFLAAGIKILNPLAPRPWNMKDFTISDPDGNMLHFGEVLS